MSGRLKGVSRVKTIRIHSIEIDSDITISLVYVNVRKWHHSCEINRKNIRKSGQTNGHG